MFGNMPVLYSLFLSLGYKRQICVVLLRRGGDYNRKRKASLAELGSRSGYRSGQLWCRDPSGSRAAGVRQIKKGSNHSACSAPS